MSDSNTRDEMIIRMNQAMLESVCTGNWAEYSQYCHSDLTYFEAETAGHLVEGLAFHHFYFNDGAASEAATTSAQPRVTVTMARPHVRWLHDDAVVALVVIAYALKVLQTVLDRLRRAGAVAVVVALFGGNKGIRQNKRHQCPHGARCPGRSRHGRRVEMQG